MRAIITVRNDLVLYTVIHTRFTCQRITFINVTAILKYRM